jgi:hypothetical protein
MRLYLCLLACAICALLAACHEVNAGKSGPLAELQPAGVPVGEPLKWRTLANFEAEASLDNPRPGMVVGDFSRDKSDDVLLIDWMGETQIIQTSGKSRTVKGDIWPAIFEFTSWDYNRDGCCELVPSNYGFVWVKEKEGSINCFGIKVNYFSTDRDFRKSSKLRLAERGKWTPLFDTKGHLAIQLSNGDEDGVIVCGDYDGDGWDELAVEEEGVREKVRVYAGVGERRGEWIMRMKPVYAMSGDVDDDGRDEFLCLEGSRIAVYAWKKERTDIQSWPLGEYPSCSADVTGDGKADILGAVCELESPAGQEASSTARQVMQGYTMKLGELVEPLPEKQARLAASNLTDEEFAAQRAAEQKEYDDAARQLQREAAVQIAPYVTPHGGILDVATGTFTPLQFPENAAYSFNIFYAKPGEIVVADIDRDGKREIIAKASIGSTIFIFNTAGELKYQEEFGKAVTMMDVAHTRDGDVLVLLTEDGVLAYP